MTLGDYEKVAALYTSLEQFSDYTKGFINDEMEAELKTYVEKVVALKKTETGADTTEKVPETESGETTE